MDSNLKELLEQTIQSLGVPPPDFNDRDSALNVINTRMLQIAEMCGERVTMPTLHGMPNDKELIENCTTIIEWSSTLWLGPLTWEQFGALLTSYSLRKIRSRLVGGDEVVGGGES